MSEAVNKAKGAKVVKNMDDKIFEQFDAVVRQKKQPLRVDQDHLSSEEKKEVQQLFDDLPSEPEGQQAASVGDQKQSPIKSILKKSEPSGKKQEGQTKTVKFVAEKKDNQDGEEQGYIVISSGRKWNEKLGNPRKGKFDPTQRRLLIQNLSQQIVIQNLKYDDIVKTLSEDEEKIPRNLHFWTAVCSVLPDRSLVSSYKFLKRELSTKNKGGEWTADETIQLQSLVKQHGTKWTLIAKQMHRTAENVRDKYRSIREQQYKPESEQTVWKFEQLVKYLRYLQKYSGVQFINEELFDEVQQSQEHDRIEMEELRKRKYNSKHFVFHNNSVVRKYISREFNSIGTDSVNWQKLSDRMQNKTIFDCRNKFIQLLQLSIYAAGSKEGVEQEIVTFITAQKPKVEASIDWSKWKSQHVDRQEAANRWMILKRHVQGRGTLAFPEIMARMQEKYPLRR